MTTVSMRNVVLHNRSPVATSNTASVKILNALALGIGFP